MLGGRIGLLVMLSVLVLAACSTTTQPPPAPSSSPTSAPMASRPAALFYTKAGSLYVSSPAGAPGRKLTDGPADAQPAPSPDGQHVAFVRKADGSDYGGDLWVLDLSPDLTPVGAARRLVERATLPQDGGGQSPSVIARPQWSPTGQQIAFVDHTADGIVNGGHVRVAAADTGALVSGAQSPVADPNFAWAPDGRHIAWIQARSDVSPVDIGVLTVSGDSATAAKDTNAYSVTYSTDGQSILFANGDASGPDFTSIPFAVRPGGIYSVPAGGGKPPAPKFTKPASYYDDVAALDDGGLAFTAPSANESSKVIEVLDQGSSVPRTVVTDVASSGQGPVWGPGDVVAYLDSSPDSALFTTDFGSREPKRVDVGVDSFAWRR